MDNEEKLEHKRPSFDISRHVRGAKHTSRDVLLKDYLKKFQNTCNRRISFYGIVKFVLCRFQVIETLLTYKKDYVFPDIVAGVMTSLFHISQGLSYGALAGLLPINGLFVAFYAPMLYAIFGSSPPLSVGAFAVLSSLTGDTVEKCVPVHSGENMTEIMIQRTLVASVLSSASGITMILCFVLKFGVCLVYFTDPLMGGYLCAASYHVVTGRISDMLGIKAPRPTGWFVIIKKWIYYFTNVRYANVPTVIVFMFTSISVTVFRFLNIRFRKYLKYTLPFEIILIIVTTFASWKLQLSEKHNVSIIGYTPMGLTKPSLPKFELLNCLGTSFGSITFVTMAINLPLATRFSTRTKRVSANQELFAYGMTNFISSFLHCFPSCASISRTATAVEYHAKTQIYALVAAILPAIIIFVIAPYLKYLPKAVLAAIVVVNMSGSLARITQLRHYLRISLTEAFIWFQSFVAVICFGVNAGLQVGLIISLMTNIVLVQRPTFRILGKIPYTNIYVDSKFPDAIIIPGIKIFIMEESLCSYNSKAFKRHALKTLNLYDEDKWPGINKLMSFVFRSASDKNTFSRMKDDCDRSTTKTKYFIVDCSAFVHIDSAGINTLLDINDIINAEGVVMLLCGLREQVLKSLEAADFFDTFKEEHNFMLLEDAVKYASLRC